MQVAPKPPFSQRLGVGEEPNQIGKIESELGLRIILTLCHSLILYLIDSS
jgi:hypothetical protein